MAANILAFIQFDDNTPYDESPFKMEASVWSLKWDYGLWGCKDYKFIGAISGIRNELGKEPLIPLRGCPPGDVPALKSLQGEPFVGFLTYPEILCCLEHHGIQINSLHRSIQVVLDVLSILAKRYGDDRVRFVFEIQE